MRKTPPVWWIALFFSVMTGSHAAGQGRRVESLDAHWRFTLGDPQGAMQPSFDDSQWRILDVPHDWSIEGPILQDSPTGPGGAFLPAGIGWYRKQLSLPTADSARRLSPPLKLSALHRVT